ncbi:hypothetical protein AC1031_000952 [Aphanomyces cochlioides]|nr:hypothetical protein AC1031_000952 [Aphanomyces cochlioides]
MPNRDVTKAVVYAPAFQLPQVVLELELAKRAAAAKKVLQKQAYRRNQSKMNQRRYRAEYKLEGRLETLRFTVPVELRTFDAECNLVREYYRLFHLGLPKNEADPKRNLLCDFLSKSMTQDLAFMDDFGQEKLLRQWMMYSTSFLGFEMVLLSMEVVSFSPNVVVHSDSTLNLRLSRSSVAMLFPHLLHNEPLVQRMIGRILILPVQQNFVFDSDFAVVKYDTYVNLAVALANLLGSLTDAATAMSGVLIKETGEIVAEVSGDC